MAEITLQEQKEIEYQAAYEFDYHLEKAFKNAHLISRWKVDDDSYIIKKIDLELFSMNRKAKSENKFNDYIKEMDEKQAKKKPKSKIDGVLRTKVYERDMYRCKHCQSYKDLSIDHIIPLKHGGTDDFDNLQTLCRSCNSKKGTKIE